MSIHAVNSRLNPSLIAIVLASLSLVAEATDTWHPLDSAAAWPANNDAVWIFGSTATLGGSFTPFLPANVLGDYYTMDAYRFSQAAFPGDYPMVAFNGTTNPLSFGSGQFQVPGQMVVLVPGADGTYAVARFVAPATGQYQATGYFEGLEGASAFWPATRTDVHVLRNSAGGLFSDRIIGQFTQKNFSLVLSLAQGDTVDFAVGYGDGSAGNYDDSTGLAVTLVQLPVLTLEPGNPPTVTWPTNAADFSLQSVTNLPPSGEWMLFPELPAVEGTNFVVTNTGSGPQRFFRLILPASTPPGL